MKSKLNPVPAAKRTEEIINTTQRNDIILKREEAQKLVTGIYEFDAKVKSKDSQIVTITKQKNDLQQLVTSKTSEVQTKNSLLVQKEQLLAQKDNLINQKTIEVQSKDSLLLQKEQLLSELRIREENQLKEEYISVLHQLNPKVFSANYEDWGGKYQGYKDLIVNGDYKTIKKHIPIHKQKLAQKIETEKLALATKEAEKLDKAKEEAVSILHQLHPHSYPVNYEDWPTHIKARKLLDSGNLQAIEKNLVVYRELLKKELARQKEEVQNKDQLILQKEQDLKILNDTFTTTISTKEEEIIAKNQLLAQEVQSKNQLALQKELEKEEIRIQKEQEIERLREELARKEVEVQEKDELLLVKESEVHNKSAEKNRIIEELESNLLTKDEVIVSKDLKIGEVSQSVKKANRKVAAKDKLLNDKEQRIEELKMLIEQSKIEKEELLAQQELALANKSHMKNQIIDGLREKVNLKKNEVVDLRIQNLEKELIAEQKEKLLIQKESELADKSFAKNQVIGELQEDIGLKEKEALNLKIELLMKQVEFHKKESELKDKALEDAHEIVKQKDIVNELQEKLLAFQNLSKHDETLQLELSVIHFKVEESIANKNVSEMEELSKQLSQFMKDPIDKNVNISELLKSLELSPVIKENSVNHPVEVNNNANISNFIDINHINTTHSVYPSGEDSYSIIQDDGSH